MRHPRDLASRRPQLSGSAPAAARRSSLCGHLLDELQRYRWPLLGGMIGLLLDLLTKDLASTLLPGRAPIELGWGLRLVHRANPGLLFGLAGEIDPLYRQPLVVGLAMLALLCVPALVGWLVRTPRLRAWSVALISAGALGNLLERLWRAEVVDFLQIGPRSWALPAFNIADAAILAGVVIVLVALLRRRPVSRHGDPERLAMVAPDLVDTGGPGMDHFRTLRRDVR